MTLPRAERERYARQLAVPGWGEEAQGLLGASSAIVVGAGALGSPAAIYLAAAGLGRIGIVDAGQVALGDLAAQPLHFAPDLGVGKADNAVVKLGALNPETEVDAYPVSLEGADAEAIVAGSDVALECSGSRASRYIVNDACCAAGLPLVTAALTGPVALVLSTRPGRSACWRCAFPAQEEGSAASPGELGAIGAVAGIVGSIQALEALKLLTGVGDPLTGRVLRLDARDMSQTVLDASRRADCPACARVPAGAQST